MQKLFGKSLLVHWEDFGGSNASRLLKKYQDEGPTFNDDIQSTAAVALASILGACQVPAALPLPEQTFVFFGAGEANLGIAQLLCDALADDVRRLQISTHAAQSWALRCRAVPVQFSLQLSAVRHAQALFTGLTDQSDR